MDRYNQLFQEIFNRPLSHNGSKSLLEKTVADYPYFTPAHFFLLHLTDRSTPAFVEQAKKTALVFNNNYWLNLQLLQLNQQDNSNSQPAEPELQVSNEGQSADILPSGHQTQIAEELPENSNQSISVIAEANSAFADTALLAKENPGDSTNEAPIVTEPQTENYFVSDTVAIDAPAVETEVAQAVEVVEDNQNQLPEAPEEIKEHIEQISLADISIPTEAVASEIEPGSNFNENAEPVSDQLNESTESTAVHFNDEPQYTDAEMEAHETLQNQTDHPEQGGTVTDAERDQVSLKMAETLAAITLDKNTIEDTVSFEPLHASDYFASVGIKLSEEIKPADRLGFQLKSFTDWLKTMKKVHAEQLTDTTTSEVFHEKNDKTIQALAEASNKENEVLTEAMADVLHQQGKISKAVEVYEKLSLLDPSKRVYFAAKINQLKD